MFGGIKYGANYVAKKTEVPSKNIIKGAGFIGKKIENTYEKIKHNIFKKNDENKEKEKAENPPEINNPNSADTKRPLQAVEEVKEEEQKKEELNINNEKIEDKKKKKKMKNNMLKIIMKKKSMLKKIFNVKIYLLFKRK